MNFRKILSITFIFFLAFTVEAFSLSPAEKAKKNYQFTLLLIRTFRIPVENFAPSENLSQYDKIKEAFFEARENFYGQNYVVAYQKYATMKADLIPFATDLAQNYLTRTKDLLDAATKYSANLLTDYTKSTPILRDIKEPRNPVRNEQVYKDDYTPKTYHLFYHGRIIETYIKEGYSTYYQAKNLFDDPEIEYMKQNEKRSPEDMDYILERYLSIIKLCRTSKQYGVEVYKLYNINDLADLSAQNNNISTINLDPTIDVRIPDKYRIDAVDNRNLVYKGKKEEQADKKE